ncbi:hypothetical protein GALMADRAFT_95203 [Galerina marginata CBS 339.88]|uniref:Protein kinase domain-containing protein n=1 Tax=Galerina marginata (strain CBS 339.88) TaxID=685588 RepID=A0A067TEU8_GALM3|nr:hypothetical protein GALMADRAFT_95203 [Galerina marginata CBS 339.88]
MESTVDMPVREAFPKDLEVWRIRYGPDDDYMEVWKAPEPLLAKHGLQRWAVGFGSQQRETKELPPPDNYIFIGPNTQRSLVRIKQYLSWNGLSHAARGYNGRDFILRVMTAGGQGHNHLDIMRRLSRPPDILRSQNHVLPMLDEIVFEDIVIGIFPRCSYNFTEAADMDEFASVEDLLYMVLQALEGITFLHGNSIAHRDLFLNNFMVEWCPASISHGRSITRPRVYIIDFETAVEFPETSSDSDRLCLECPFERETYGRPMPPELESGDPYSPFLLDIWQFGSDLHKDHLVRFCC